MAETTGISWTNSTWNPVTGCQRVSPGCDHCYALELAERMRGAPGWPVGFDLQLREKALRYPVKWKTPRRIFVNSMSDLFWQAIPEDYLRRVWDVMLEADQHIYQVLTKRPHLATQKIERLGLEMADHIWMGVSVESQRFADHRIPELSKIPAKVRFLSCEPLLGELDLWQWLHPLRGVDVITARMIGQGMFNSDQADSMRRSPDLQWVIVGGESGKARRPLEWDWVRSIRDQCSAADVAFYLKQGSALRPDQDYELDGEVHRAFPEVKA